MCEAAISEARKRHINEILRRLKYEGAASDINIKASTCHQITLIKACRHAPIGGRIFTWRSVALKVESKSALVGVFFKEMRAAWHIIERRYWHHRPRLSQAAYRSLELRRRCFCRHKWREMYESENIKENLAKSSP